MPTRDDVLAFLAPLDGLRAPAPEYVELLMPAAIEPEASRRAVLEQSGCALLVRAAWRALGCAHPILHRPYRVGRAVADVEQIARDLGAWRTPDDRGIYEGDAVIVGVPPATRGAPWTRLHVYTITSIITLPFEGARVASIDGGQGPHGAGVAARMRSWPSWSDRWLDIADATPASPELEREVYGWVDVERILTCT